MNTDGHMNIVTILNLNPQVKNGSWIRDTGKLVNESDKIAIEQTQQSVPIGAGL